MTRQTKPAKAPKPVKAWAIVTNRGRLLEGALSSRIRLYRRKLNAEQMRLLGEKIVRVEIRVLGGKK